MTKVQIKKEKITPFGGIYFVTRQFKPVERAIDEYLGRRCASVGYQYGEIVRAMMCNFFCGGDRTEDINVIKERLCQGPDGRLCSPDTVLRMLSQLTVADTVYESVSGKQYRFNTAEALNGLLVYAAVKCGQLVPGRSYDLDFDHEFLKAEKWDARWTYKGMLGYSPAVAVLTDVKTGEQVIVGIENRDGNANVKFRQEDTLNRILYMLALFGLKVRYARMDCGSYSRPVVKLLLEHCERIFIRAEMSQSLRARLDEPQVWRKAEINGIEVETTSLPFDAFGDDAPNCRLVVQRTRKGRGEQLDIFDSGQYTCRAILTNEKRMTEPAVITYYNQRGAGEKIFDQMDNDFGWHYLPKSEMGQNAVFMLITAIIRNFYERLLRIDMLKRFGIEARTRMKAFIAKLIAVPAKWIRTGRRYLLNLYTSNEAYIGLFAEYG